MTTHYTITAKAGQATDLTAEVRPNGTIVVHNPLYPKVPARKIAAATVANRGGAEAVLNWVYRTGVNRTYYTAVIAAEGATK